MIDAPVRVLKERARRACSKAEPELLEFSSKLYSEPELGLSEHIASGLLAEALGRIPRARVVHGLGSLPTAVCAEVGEGDLVITLCAEYDALPEVGHACGHNIIASAALGAFIALQPVVDDIGVTLRLLGTPAEEGGIGGKAIMLKQGDFDGTHAAMMIHPYADDLVGFRSYAAASYDVRYTGRSAHASAAPHEGVNALDAITIAMTAIGLARQQLQPGQQIHGFLKHGGNAPSVIPASAAAEYMVRATTLDSLASAVVVLTRCLEAGAVATCCELTVTQVGPMYAELRNDEVIERYFLMNMGALGRNPTRATGVAASTDMGNVSQQFPTIHPMIGLGQQTPPIHSAAFADHTMSRSGKRAILDGALAIAWTCIDIATNPPERERLIRIAGSR